MRHNGSFLSPLIRPSLAGAKAVWGLREAFEALGVAEWPVPSSAYAVNTHTSVGGTASVVTSINSGAFPTSAGNSIAVFVGWYSTATVTVSDTMGNTYTACTVVSATGPTKGQWFYSMNIGGSSSSNVITVTFSSGSDYTTGEFVLISGGGLKQFDVSNGATSTGTSVTSPSFNTAGAGIVLVGRTAFNAQNTTSFSSPYTAIGAFPSGPLFYNSTAKNIFSGGQTGITVTETGNSSTNRALAVLALK
jgi:hypothetical protein